MALLLPHSVFFHVPKTGGTWIRRAVANAGIPANEVYGVRMEPLMNAARIFHARPDDVRPQGFFRFAFVRHPLAVYRSYWLYRLRHPDPLNEFDKTYLRDDFHAFVSGVLAGAPGWVSNGFAQYVGRRCELVDYVGRQERLADDLVRALRLAGEEFDEAALRATPKINEAGASAEDKARAVWTPELRSRVCAAEEWSMRTFGYAEEDVRVG